MARVGAHLLWTGVKTVTAMFYCIILSLIAKQIHSFQLLKGFKSLFNAYREMGFSFKVIIPLYLSLLCIT